MSDPGGLRRAGLLLVDAAAVGAGCVVALLVGARPGAVLVLGLAAYGGLYVAALLVLHGTPRRGTRRR